MRYLRFVLLGLVALALMAVTGNTVSAQPQVVATIAVSLQGGSHGFAVNTQTNTVFMSDRNEVWVIDGESNTVVGTVPLESFGNGGYGIAVNPNTDLVYVRVTDTPTAEYGSVVVIDGVTLDIVKEIPMTVPIWPGGIAVNPMTDKVYVANGYMGAGMPMGRSVSIIDGLSNTLLKVISVGYMPYGVDVNPVSNRIYVTNDWSDTVSVIDGSIDEVVATIPVLQNPGPLAVNSQTNTVYVRDYAGVPQVTVIDGQTNTIIGNIAIYTHGLAANSLTNRLYVSEYYADRLVILDGTDNSVVASVPVGSGPRAVAVNERTGRVYVYNTGDGTISVIQDDADGDGVGDATDNCPLVFNPGQENDDGDPFGDACDNCPDTTNPGQENADGDQWGDACENCAAVATPWWVLVGDGDCDGFTDGDEGIIGTDPADRCANTSDPNDEADDRWPSDFDDNQVINVLDVNEVLPPYFGTLIPPTSPRRDLVVDGVINILDVNMTLPPFFGYVCAP